LSPTEYNFTTIIELDGGRAYVSDNHACAVPIVEGIPFFNEADFDSASLLERKCSMLYQSGKGHEREYEKFVRQKSRRPSYDIYACFQSYNEAWKAFYPFIKTLRKNLEPGDIILNLWDRTGWMSCMLQGFFPSQRVFSFWEGDRDILGYKGFSFWHGKEDNGKGVNFAFANLERPLPFADKSISLIFGLDTFHRFDQSTLLNEVLRIAKKDAAIIFPHVHLSNADPVPFFERGCRQLHGLDYQAFFDKLLVTQGRKGFVIPETELFEMNELMEDAVHEIESDPDTKHYNALIAILPCSWPKMALNPFGIDDLVDLTSCYLLVNPLLSLRWHEQVVEIDRDKYSGRIGYLLDRHPIYLKKLSRAAGYRLSEKAIKLLYLAGELFSIERIIEILKLDELEAVDLLRDLQSRDIVQIVPVTQDEIRMQRFITSQEYVLPDSKLSIRASWLRAVDDFGKNLFIISEDEDIELTYVECNQIIQNISYSFQVAGLKKGDQVALLNQINFEAILTILAAAQMGIVVVPIDCKLPHDTINLIIDEVEPALVFVDEHLKMEFEIDRNIIVQFDGGSDDSDYLFFSDWIQTEEETGLTAFPDISPSDLAAILYTSGSTGIPKGVMLNNGQLVRSGRLITECFHWNEDDRFLAIGELDSMSGFRNSCLAPLEIGASIILPSETSKSNLLSICACIGRYKASILGTTPSLVSQMIRFSDRIKLDVNDLRIVLCTGSTISEDMKRKFMSIFKVPVLNYYGLTETTGICISEAPDSTPGNLSSSLGLARNCIVQVVNEDGEVLRSGEEGELRIYSQNLMMGYYKRADLTASVVKDGWFYTGDVVSIATTGEVEFRGRIKDIIKTSDGNLVHTSEIRMFLENHLLVAEVEVLPIEKKEKMVAFVVLVEGHPGEEKARYSITQSLRERIGQRKFSIDLTLKSELPRNANGKVIRSQLYYPNESE